MRILRSRRSAEGARRRHFALGIAAGSAAIGMLAVGSMRGADEPAPSPSATFRQYCFQCHGKGAAMGGISLEALIAAPSVGENFQKWEKVATVLTEGRMPPKGMPQPGEAERRQAVSWIRSEMAAFVKKHDGDPGRVTVRRLTSGEYAYTLHDLTGLDLDLGIDPASDSVGGEGFTNFGDVQFMQDASLERYLEAAKKIADHAVIGAGPIEFFSDPGKSGFEMSAINRIKEIYTANGFRTVSGEGGFPFGQEKYGKALYAAWRFRHRAALGEPTVTLRQLAAREGIPPRFAEHIWSVMNDKTLAYPSNEMAARWQKLPDPGPDATATETTVRAACGDLQKFITTWPSWLFSRGDSASGGAGDESPLIISEKSLAVQGTHHFVFNRGGRGGGAGGGGGNAAAAGAGRGAQQAAGPAKIYLNVTSVNPMAKGKPVIIWRNPTVAYRKAGAGRGTQPAQPAIPAGDFNDAQPVGRFAPPPGPKQPLRSVVSEETAKALNFGTASDGSAIGPDDFAAESSVSFEVPVPQGMIGFQFDVDAQIGADRDQVFRITITDRADGGSRGIPVRSLLGDPKSSGYQTFKAGVLQLASIMPPNANFEPTPADKDPIPEPFDSAYNVPEHDEFDTRVKYVRDDRFIYQHVLDDATRARVDNAWNDLYTSFAYHDNYLDMLAQHFKLDLHGKHIGDLDQAQLASLPAEARKYIEPLIPVYKAAVAAEAASHPRHVQDCLEFASRAWRRPLTEKEKLSLRAFYDKSMTGDPDHRAAIRSLIARILVSPAFLYRVEQPVSEAMVKPLSEWEMASRLSYFLWSSIPDDELRRAAAAGELANPQQVQKQVKRMLADPKSRRLSTEFFGQWLGFYRFDQFRGVDTGRFPEFTNDVKQGMYDEAISFFEHIIRKDRPVGEMLFANYTFLTPALAKYYGVKHEFKAKDQVEMVQGPEAAQRGGLLRLGAVLTAFSAPLRTSPVKRGDWVLRRLLGTAVPPPPADAGSIPADDKLFGGLSVREKLEAHKRNATCANCHARIDPLGFPLEHYDSTGRWRDQYPDGKPIWDSGELSDKTQIAGVNGLLDYLRGREDQFLRTLSHKLVGYALGRTVQASDEPLIDRMVVAGGQAGFSQLVAEVAASKQFRNRLGKDNAPATAAVKVAAAKPNSSDKVGGR